MSLLTIEDVHTYYGESHILRGVSLAVQKGEVLAVVGRNGVGKTTLIRSIIGMTPPRRGQVLLNEKPIHRLALYKIARAGIGLVPQGRRIFPSLTVREHLRVAARPAVEGFQGKVWDLAAVYSLFPRLKEREGNFGSQLSGGEQQMLAISRALMTNPQVLLMDEPTEGLAPLIVREIARTIPMLADSGLGVVLVEQNLVLALEVANRMAVLSKGTIVYRGTPEELTRDEGVRYEHLGV